MAKKRQRFCPYCCVRVRLTDEQYDRHLAVHARLFLLDRALSARRVRRPAGQ